MKSPQPQNGTSAQKANPKRKNEPATPPPPDASGKRKRLREFMDWDIRPMNEAVRSVVQDTDGKKLLVINNIFPGFKISKGNIVYLIETAALQLAKPDDDEKLSTEEYLEKFDELYSFFCVHLNDAKEKLETKKTETPARSS